MKRTFQTIALVLTLSAAAVACGDSETSDVQAADTTAEADPNDEPSENADDQSEPTEEDQSDTDMEDESAAPIELDDARQALIGLSLSDADAWAAKNGMVIRVVNEDGEEFAVTGDFSLDRINVAVADGSVTEVIDIG